MVKKRVKNRKKKESVLVFGAHSDDSVIGAGGTIAKYGIQGKKVISIVFSYGEKSHPWLKEKIIKKRRSDEAFKANRLLGCKTVFFDLGDQRVGKDYLDKGIEEKLIKMIKREKPGKIFTHSGEDVFHPDHRSVYKITLDVWENLPQPRPEIYVYSIWNPVDLNTQYPVLYEDISQTFSLKVKALKLFRSQRFNAIYPLMLMVFYKAIKTGFKIKKRFGEKFYRIR